MISLCCPFVNRYRKRSMSFYWNNIVVKQHPSTKFMPLLSRKLRSKRSFEKINAMGFVWGWDGGEVKVEGGGVGREGLCAARCFNKDYSSGKFVGGKRKHPCVRASTYSLQRPAKSWILEVVQIFSLISGDTISADKSVSS